jgi:DNA-directed RNA polymerase sigma subunit (sigma70/sigma32)
MGISGERVRQVEEQALEQLKHSAILKGLHDESSY